MSIVVDIPKTFGALLLGGLFSSLLSGLVIVQVVIYFKIYPRDPKRLKALVVSILVLDICHTAFIWAALWSYFVVNYGVVSNIDVIHWNVALTIIMTAILTFLVHLFFAHRIFLLSKKNYYLTIPIVLFAVLRLVSASVTTGEMLHLKTYTKFKEEIRWVFTTGLALSSSVDILITASLFALLHASRPDNAGHLNAVIDTLIRYAFETGSLTCAGTIISMICWLAMPSNLIFLGLHFVIGKLYANSLLVTLNTRDRVRRVRSHSQSKELAAMPVHLVNTRRQPFGTETDQSRHSDSPTDSKGQIIGSSTLPQTQLEVNVERTVIYDTAS